MQFIQHFVYPRIVAINGTPIEASETVFQLFFQSHSKCIMKTAGFF
jgi:hypothetical protein